MRLATKLAIAGALSMLTALPAAAETGPTLKTTLDFIRDKLQAEGPLNYITAVHDSVKGDSWTNTWSDLQSNVSDDLSGCQISFHWRTAQNGKVSEDKDAYFRLGGVTDVQVMTNDSLMDGIDAGDGHPTWSTRTNPPLFIVKVVLSDQSNLLEFKSEDTANRVARAIRYGAQICGHHQPF